VPVHPYLSIPRRVNPVVGKVIDDWNAKAVDIVERSKKEKRKSYIDNYENSFSTWHSRW